MEVNEDRRQVNTGETFVPLPPGSMYTYLYVTVFVCAFKNLKIDLFVPGSVCAHVCVRMSVCGCVHAQILQGPS